MSVTCLYCYEDFTTEVNITGFCSDDCYLSWTDRLQFSSNCSNKFYNKKRRRIIMSGDKINRIILSEQYNWICQLCFGDIPPNVRFPHDLSSTVDHIIPISLGGKHTFDNVQPAHLKCNIDKGNNVSG